MRLQRDKDLAKGNSTFTTSSRQPLKPLNTFVSPEGTRKATHRTGTGSVATNSTRASASASAEMAKGHGAKAQLDAANLVLMDLKEREREYIVTIEKQAKERDRYKSERDTIKEENRKLRSDAKGLQREIEALQNGEEDDSMEVIDTLRTEVDTLKGNVHTLSTDVTGLNKSNNEYKTMNQKLKVELEGAMTILREKGVSSVHEESLNIRQMSNKYIKNEGYRRWKFINSEQDSKNFMSDCYSYVLHHIPTFGEDEHEDYCSFSEYQRIYTKQSSKVLAGRRQLSQTNMFKAVKGECE